MSASVNEIFFSVPCEKVKKKKREKRIVKLQRSGVREIVQHFFLSVYGLGHHNYTLDMSVGAQISPPPSQHVHQHPAADSARSVLAEKSP